MNPAETPAPAQRFHELDALRAFAMLLGIGLHAALSFTGFPWIVQDTHTSFLFALLVVVVHGFRMQLFMLVSGFFTMMLYRKRGLRALSNQRFRRVFVPCLLGLFTIVPAFDLVTVMAVRHASQPEAAVAEDSSSAIYSAVRRGDAAAIKKELDAGADPNQSDPRFRITLLGWAALKGDVEAARILIDAGAQVDAGSGEGHRPIHHAAFLGHADVLALLAEKGADLAARSNKGETVAQSARTELQATRFLTGVLGLSIPPDEELRKGREECLNILERHAGAMAAANPPQRPGLLTRARNAYAEWIRSDRFLTGLTRLGRPIHLFETDIFHHLWFLWYLCWLVGLFVLSATVRGRLPDATPMWRKFQGRGGLATLIVITFIPQLFMGTSAAGTLGPDTSTGLLPMPHLLIYYGIFFACGAILFDARQVAFERVDRYGWWLPIGLCLALPATFAAYGKPVASGLAQGVYAWVMIFGMIRLFRKRFAGESRAIRYLADSSYWLYLAHLPLVVAGQALVSTWNFPSGLKFLGLTACATAVLLLSYQLLVRNMWIGRLLNGPGTRVQ